MALHPKARQLARSGGVQTRRPIVSSASTTGFRTNPPGRRLTVRQRTRNRRFGKVRASKFGASKVLRTGNYFSFSSLSASSTKRMLITSS